MKDLSFIVYASGIRLPDCSKLAVNAKNDSSVVIFRRYRQLFWRGFVSVVKFSYWSKFHVNIITGSGVMTVSFIRDWPEIWKSEIPPSGFCPISGDWGGVRDTKCGTNVSIKMLLNAAKFQSYSFDRFWVIKGKPTGVGVK